MKFREKIAFGMCGTSYELLFITITTYLLVFCTDVLGIPPQMLSPMFVVVSVFDALTDAVVAHLADKTRTRWGAYRPWILFAGLGAGLTFAALFSPPSFLQDTNQLAAWEYAVYAICICVFVTCVMCCTGALNAVVSEDWRERMSFGSARALGESAGDVLCNLLAMPIILAFGGIGVATGWHVMALLFGAVVILCAIAGFAGTKERTRSQAREDARGIGLFRKMGLLLGVRPVRQILLVYVLLSIENPFTASAMTYFCMCTMGHEEWISSLFVASMIAQVLANVAAPRLGTRLTARRTIMIGAAVLAVGFCGLLAATGYIGCLFVMVCRGVGHGLIIPSMYSLVPDAADYAQRQTGVYLPGMCNGIVNFGTKAANGIGLALASSLLVWVQYDASLGIQSALTCDLIRFLLAGITIAIAVLLLVGMLRAKAFGKEELDNLRNGAVDVGGAESTGGADGMNDVGGAGDAGGKGAC